MSIIDTLQRRYSTKHFDPNFTLSDEKLVQLEDLLRLSPSSTNIQPWHFILAHSEEGKARIAKSTQGFFGFNEQKVKDAAAVIVFCTRIDLGKDYLDHLLDVEEADGRYGNPEFKAQNQGGRAIFSDFHKYDFKDAIHWAEKQVYLNLGNFLLGVADLGLDALPMEGCEMKVLDAEFGLRERGFIASVVVAVGKHAEGDFNASLPKSRLPKAEIIERV